MKKLCTAVCLLCVYYAAGAQEYPWPKLKPFILRAEIGGISPHEVEFSSQLGLTLGAGLGVRLGRAFSVLAMGRYSGIPHNAGALEGLVAQQSDTNRPKLKTESDFPFRHTEFALEAHYRFNANPRDPSAYLIGGVGYISVFRQKMSAEFPPGVVTTITEQTQNSIGYIAGLGVDVPFSRDRVSAFAEVRFSKGVVQIDASNINPYYLQVHAGVQVNL